MMLKFFLIIFFTSCSLLQVSSNNSTPYYHFISEEAVFIEDFEQPIYEDLEQPEELTRPSLDDFFDELWDGTPPYAQKIILFIGGVGLVVGTLITLGYPSV